MEHRPRAFVLMPFAGEFTAIYTDLIKPALEDAGYEVARADSFFDQQNILRDVVRGIGIANLIVADLTTLNPNVLYELGLCHGLHVPAILLAQSIDEVPFDLRGYRIQVYSTHFSEVHKLKASLQEIGERHKRGEVSFGSPITDFLPSYDKQSTKEKTQIDTEERQNIDEDTPEVDEEDKGWLDFVVEGNAATEELSIIMQEFIDETNNIGSRIQTHSTRLETVAENAGPGAAVQARKIALLAASDMNNFSANVERIAPGFEKKVNAITESFSGYASLMGSNSEQEITVLNKFRQDISELLQGARSGLEGIRFFRNAAASLIGINKEINQASRRMVKNLDRIISSTEQVEAFCVRTLHIIEEKIGIDIQSEDHNIG